MNQEKGKEVGVRQVVELAISTGRAWQSPQTGYIHYCPHQAEESEHHTIPLFENLLFILSLFRSRSVENVAEGKKMLARLLAFQSSEGAYPKFLHEYPEIIDRNACIFLLLPLYWMRKDFSFALEKDLGPEIDRRAAHLLEYAFAQVDKFGLSYVLRGVTALSAIGWGRILSDEKITDKGKELESTLFPEEKDSAWGSIEQLGLIYAALEVAGDSKSPSWSSFYRYLDVVWHPYLKAYSGPALDYLWKGDLPEPSLLDLAMGVRAGFFPPRLFQNSPLLLQGALLQKQEEKKEEDLKSFNLYQTQFKEGVSFFCRGEKYAAAAIFTDKEKEKKKGFMPFYTFFGDDFSLFSLAANGKARLFDANFNEEGLITRWEIDYPASQDEKEGDLSFYIEDKGDLEWLIGSDKATVFHLGEAIYLKAAGMTWQVVFYLEEGSGSFVGQVLKGNRPPQIMNKGQHRFAAFDWMFTLRTVRRSYPCILRLDFQLVS